ncbi:MAG: hypothetical protein ACRD0U_15565 [Acidimicrobiales bacterium]
MSEQGEGQEQQMEFLGARLDEGDEQVSTVEVEEIQGEEAQL